MFCAQWLRIVCDWDQVQRETYNCARNTRISVSRAPAMLKHANMETRPLGKKSNEVYYYTFSMYSRS
jgi:hypothetical protein